MSEMKPTQGYCKDCKYCDKEWNCSKLQSVVEGWWTGCVMWEEKEKQTSIHYTAENQGWW